MPRPKAGWVLRPPITGRHVYRVRFTHLGRTVERSTHERNREEAAKAAERIYAAVVLGEHPPLLTESRAVLPKSGPGLSALFSDWIAEYGATHAAGTTANVEGYARLFLFSRLEMTAAGYARYMRERIARVTRTTLRKELSALRQFVAWCNDDPRRMGLPPVPGLPKRGHPGQRATNARKRVAVILAPEDVQRAINRLRPSWRALFVVCWETALRPLSTVARLSVPDHWTPGASRIFVSREIDKTRYERTVPITPAARAALTEAWVAAGKPDAGRLFPGVTKDAARWVWSAALFRAGLAARGAGLYDLRHSRISQWANAPGANLAGVSFLAGHKHVSTTALYVRAGEAAAARTLETGPAQKSTSPGEPPRADGP